MQEAAGMKENAQLSQELPLEQQPLVVRQRHVFPGVLLPLILLVLCFLFLSGGILGIIYYQWPFLSAINGLTISGAQSQTTVAAPPVIDRVARSFMDAMMHKDWATLWSLLHPDAQQSWQGESDFMHFEQVKFGSLKFISYSVIPMANRFITTALPSNRSCWQISSMMATWGPHWTHSQSSLPSRTHRAPIN